MQTILVTGGAGFIGSNLTLSLLKQGHRVTVLDNYFTGSPRTLEACREYPSFKEIKHDINRFFFSSEEIDLIYHLACPASPVHYQRDPINTLMTCVNGTYQLLKLAKEKRAKLLFASTSEVYGDPKEHPQKETYRGWVNPIGIRSCYDEGKRAAESLCMDFIRTYHLGVKVVRIFNTYGENMNPNDGRVVSNFIVQALKGEDLTVYGDGQQTRSFCYISDLVDGIMSMMNDCSGCSGPVNLGNPSEITVNRLAEEILFLTESKSKIVQQSLPLDDPCQRKPDIALAVKQLGWTPQTSLRDGLKKTIEYFSHATSW